MAEKFKITPARGVKALLRRVEDYRNEIGVYRFGNVELDFKKFQPLWK